MKMLLTATAIAVSIVLGTNAAAATKSARKPVAKVHPPSQGYRCPSADSAGAKKSPPAGAVVVRSLKLTRLKRPTPTSAILRVDAAVTAPKDAEIFYTYSVTGGRTVGDGPRVTWTLDGAGTWTISLEVYNRSSHCTTFTSANYTIPPPKRPRSKAPAR
jgi:hypothetical protein